MACAKAAGKLGTGRSKSSDPINYATGIELLVKVGDTVTEGEYFFNKRSRAYLGVFRC